jgi:UDP-2,3-diacylglucosamine hydrolase
VHYDHAHLLSDLHLEAGRPALTAIFQRFLGTRARTAPALFLLGDIFEVWVGDDDDEPLIEEIARSVRQVSAAGVAVYFMHGNRDFLVGRHYAERLGATLLSDPVCVTLGGITTVLSHGDAMCTAEVEYQAFRQQSRRPEWQAQILARPLAERRAMARQMRNDSTNGQRDKLQAGMGLADVDPREVSSVVQAYAAERLIHGHTHQPAEHVVICEDGRKALRIVLSDWHEHAGEALEVLPDGSFLRHVLR